jgi:hypothetical protein
VKTRVRIYERGYPASLMEKKEGRKIQRGKLGIQEAGLPWFSEHLLFGNK